MPKIKNNYYIKNFSKNLMRLDSLDFIDLSEKRIQFNSFNKVTQLYRNYGAINLNFIELTGNIIIQSKTIIRVNNSAKLKDVILVAPRIEIDDGVIGNFQAIATKNISLGKNCSLFYPSALILAEEYTDIVNATKQEKISQITIASNSEVKGLVCYLCDKTPNLYKPQILVEENAVIKGELYCEQNLELKGKVEGMVYTKGFIANQFGSIYQNHIYNAKIIIDDLPKQFSGLQFENFPQSIVKWLY
ncbi:MAG: hypothetical protein L3J08_01545 [Flavobacteriaceae bacterium]|nr:hypothetical protein [Flavobacteriaceae bacterium]